MSTKSDWHIAQANIFAEFRTDNLYGWYDYALGLCHVLDEADVSNAISELQDLYIFNGLGRTSHA